MQLHLYLGVLHRNQSYDTGQTGINGAKVKDLLDPVTSNSLLIHILDQTPHSGSIIFSVYLQRCILQDYTHMQLHNETNLHNPYNLKRFFPKYILVIVHAQPVSVDHYLSRLIQHKQKSPTNMPITMCLSQCAYHNMPITMCLSQCAYHNMPITMCLSQFACHNLQLEGHSIKCMPTLYHITIVRVWRRSGYALNYSVNRQADGAKIQ